MICLAGFSVWAMREIKQQKDEKARHLTNYKFLRDIDSLHVADLKFNSKKELQEYVDSNKSLSELVKQQDIKLKRANKIIYQKQNYINNFKSKADVTTIVENIRENKPSTAAWKDSTDCLILKGEVEYKNDSLSVNVLSREFNNEVLIIGGWSYNNKNLFTRWFGRKKAKVTVTNKCGTSKTILIEKNKK